MNAFPRTLILLVGVAACSDGTGPGSGFDTSRPVALNARPDDAIATTYKGLPIRLVERGQPIVTAVDGVIGVVCVGMSNARIECDAWLQALATDWAGEVNGSVRVVNCAVGGHAIEKWIDPQFDERLWDSCRNRRVRDAGLRVDQIRVVVHKAANQFTVGPGGEPLPEFPDPGSDYEAFVDHLEAFSMRVPVEFPSVRAVYTSSRSYGGFSTKDSRGEPLSYEEGHALNSWLATEPSPGGVWFGWGAYLWAPECGAGPTDATGFCYERDDFRSDGVHPSEIGASRIAARLHRRLMDEAWYGVN
ncbi:MAG: hypothetical protein HKN71_12260 [Gemmatimonadetes bacterium]|nr:hypothetical protein [Gemmatimonadota bacterium]